MREAINFIAEAWEDISDTTIKNCWRTTRIMPEIDELEMSEQEESESENEIDDTAALINDFSNPEAQQLVHNIEEYAYIIDQPARTEDVLTDNIIIKMAINEFRDDDKTDDDEGSPPPPITVTEAVEALEKVISYQESLEVGKGFDENGLKMLRKRLKEWHYEREKNKKQSSLISFFSCINEPDISITL
ncbi:10447_t:CDS:1 [Dentiscutata erythropus]|uniref:10447_t:CDS:1 n=2 Tax=Diversisporales TaxID=214509 RepID=A0A9N9J7H4_9GLOM|nr:10447_t:CDS:1 [Dentiscutata erythropus]